MRLKVSNQTFRLELKFCLKCRMCVSASEDSIVFRISLQVQRAPMASRLHSSCVIANDSSRSWTWSAIQEVKLTNFKLQSPLKLLVWRRSKLRTDRVSKSTELYHLVLLIKPCFVCITTQLSLKSIMQFDDPCIDIGRMLAIRCVNSWLPSVRACLYLYIRGDEEASKRRIRIVMNFAFDCYTCYIPDKNESSSSAKRQLLPWI